MSIPMATGAGRRAVPAAGGSDLLLRRSLRLDGYGTAVFGLVMLVGGRWLSGPLGLPGVWFVPIGGAMLVGAAALVVIARRPRIPARSANTAVAVNVLSGVLMLPVAFAGVLPLTRLGVAFLLAGAAWVLTFAALASAGQRRAGQLS
ncbi:hypothetical protein ACWENR_22310 [Micromonospora sp. NPDC004336]